MVSGQRMDFYREDITFRLDSTNFSVEGNYWFSNMSDEPVHNYIFYPLPESSKGRVDSFFVYNISGNKRIDFTLRGNEGISFHLNIEPRDTLLLQIYYRQRPVSNPAVYILKTTEAWGKSLDLAEYKLITPRSFTIKKFSYPPDKLYQIEELNVHYWRKENFMPQDDMVFYY